MLNRYTRPFAAGANGWMDLSALSLIGRRGRLALSRGAASPVPALAVPLLLLVGAAALVVATSVVLTWPGPNPPGPLLAALPCVAVLGATWASSRRQIRRTKSLRSREAQLRAVVDGSPMAIILFTLDGRITHWNVAAEKLYGWSAAEVLGRPLPTVPPQRLSERLAFQDRVNAGEEIPYAEVWRRRKDGSEICIGLSVAPLVDAAGEIYGQMSISFDMSSRLHKEEELRTSEELYRQLVERAPVPVAVYPLDGDTHPVLYSNRRAQEIGHLMQPPDLAGVVVEAVVGARQGACLAGHKRHLRAANGDALVVLVSFSPVTYRDEPAVMIVIEDFTELERTQGEMRQQEHAPSVREERKRLSGELPDGLAARIMGESAQSRHSADAQPDTSLTEQQLTILERVAQGKLYKEIAAELNVTERTIKYHMGQILERLHLDTREQAIAYVGRLHSDRRRPAGR